MLCWERIDSRPSDSLAQRLNTPEDPYTAAQMSQIRSVLPDDPVQELLERLTRELPEEDERVRPAKPGGEPVVDWSSGLSVDVALENEGGYPGRDEDQDDRSLQSWSAVQLMAIGARCETETR